MKNSIIKKTIIIVCWIICWQIIALCVADRILLVGPYDVAVSLFSNMRDKVFLTVIGYSVMRIGLGFVSGMLLGLLLAALSYKFELIAQILSPAVTAIKAVPVASFVVLLLIWAGADNLSFFISLLIVFPNIYHNTLTGLKNTDKEILKMAEVFDFSVREKAVFIYRKSVAPYLQSSVNVAVGMAWKSGVAAEVIGLSNFSLGERIYMSKVYLDTASLFSWTVMVIVLSCLCEKLVVWILKEIVEYKPVIRKAKRESKRLNKDINMRGISVSFGEKKVLDNVDIDIKHGSTVCLMGPSGIGKTTLINCIIDDGNYYTSVDFQEDRLLEEYDALTNVLLGASNVSIDECKQNIKELLPEDETDKPVKDYSKGMKRRVSLLRALLCDRDILILDEPFAGLDEERRDKCIELIQKNRNGRTLIVVTHDTEDAKRLKGEVWKLG